MNSVFSIYLPLTMTGEYLFGRKERRRQNLWPDLSCFWYPLWAEVNCSSHKQNSQPVSKIEAKTSLIRSRKVTSSVASLRPISSNIIWARLYRCNFPRGKFWLQRISWLIGWLIDILNTRAWAKLSHLEMTEIQWGVKEESQKKSNVVLLPCFKKN